MVLFDLVEKTEQQKVSTPDLIALVFYWFGKTAVSGSTAGIQMKPAGELSVVRDANHAFILNRLSSDGNIALFQKDGTTIGVIQAYYGDMKLGTGDTGLIFGDGQDAIYPATTVTAASRDAAIDLGLSTARFKDLYLSGK